MRRTVLALLTTVTLAMTTALTAGPAHAATRDYDLPEAGVFLEGIGVDDRAGLVYVSATNRSGTIYRGEVGSGRLDVWQGPTPGDNGRGIDVDDRGRVFVAGGPSAEVRVFSRSGRLLAELPTGEPGSFLNDVRVADDGSVYVTDSSLPRIWRVRQTRAGWTIELWRDVSGTITYTPALTDFDLGGIVTTPDGDALLTTQGTTGQLWRIDLRTRRITEVALDGAPLVNADGIVLTGRTLYVVQNFSRQITELRLGERWRTARTQDVVATPADRTFTTAKLVGGRLLLVDSKFGFTPAQAVAEDRVVALKRF